MERIGEISNDICPPPEEFAKGEISFLTISGLSIT
jgi:hypothetical protein